MCRRWRRVVKARAGICWECSILVTIVSTVKNKFESFLQNGFWEENLWKILTYFQKSKSSALYRGHGSLFEQTWILHPDIFCAKLCGIWLSTSEENVKSLWRQQRQQLRRRQTTYTFWAEKVYMSRWLRWAKKHIFSSLGLSLNK